MVLNQPFRGFVCYQWVEVDFVSPRSRETFAGCSFLPESRLCGRLGHWGYFREPHIVSNDPGFGKD